MKKILSFFILLLFGIYGVLLTIQNKLGLYIHPRFFNISIVASIFAIVIGIIGIITFIIETKPHFKLPHSRFILITVLTIVSFLTSPLFLILGIILLFAPTKDNNFSIILKHLSIMFIIVLLIVSVGLLLPAKGLSSITASQRSVDLNSINLTENTINTSNGFNNNTKNYTIGDWIASITYNPDLNFYKGKDVSLIGFIYHPDTLKLDNNVFLLSRFIITCCAVDARPVGLKVKYDWSKDYKQDQWVKIDGTFDVYQEDLIIIPSKLEKTESPSNPYIY